MKLQTPFLDATMCSLRWTLRDHLSLQMTCQRYPDCDSGTMSHFRRHEHMRNILSTIQTSSNAKAKGDFLHSNSQGCCSLRADRELKGATRTCSKLQSQAPKSLTTRQLTVKAKLESTNVTGERLSCKPDCNSIDSVRAN